MKEINFTLLCIFVGYVPQMDCAKILGVFVIPGPSQYMAGSTMMKILANKGHQVTVLSVFGEKHPPENYRDVVLHGIYEKFTTEQQSNMFNRVSQDYLKPLEIHQMTMMLMDNVFNHTNFKKLMDSNEDFDLVIVEQLQTEALKYIAHHFKAPLIIYSAMDSNYWTNPYQGNPEPPSYVPNVHLPYTCSMNFFQRLWNTLMYCYNELLRELVVHPQQNALLRKYYPQAPSLESMAYNVSLVLLNSDMSVYEPVPKVPSMVSIGGFHIQPPKDLPQDLQRVLDEAENGVIYFSMGSNLKGKNIPKETRDFILRTLSELKEVVLWKFEDENLEGKPKNVIIKKWFPQNDILAHKNVKVFITHGGIFSSMEAVYHGVPLLALPVFADQYMNSIRATLNGYAKYIPFRELTEESFRRDLEQLLKNPIYRSNVAKRSLIMKDKPISPIDNLIFHVEYVIRHKGAHHLKVAALDLNKFQYLLLDVVAFILCSVLVIILLIKCTLKRLFSSKNTKNKEE
ncbi:UDP-glucosyltransferase 2-like [Coccinella septempunctata]|uniref:UDP-glucosyltransferase 2-like n=1 Tax=Coccinella septempunctata TaxID=41139 RepID=UPI001D08E966|nr:UDP-glucosyltransferase 2-like [Coccinella septempunctata]